MPTRGSYAKGIAKRQEILRAALEIFAQRGYQKTSLRELAERVNLSQAGVLHYFGSKEELLTEVLRMRDARDQREYVTDGDSAGNLAALMRHNADVPGLVSLYATMSATAAADPEHPAHPYFRERYRTLRASMADSIRRFQRDGKLAADIDADKVAGILIAVADGLQTQWMLEPSLDMAEHVEYVWSLLVRQP